MNRVFPRASAPPFDSLGRGDEAADLAVALALQRFYEDEEAQAAADEAVAYSLTMEQARHLHAATDPEASGRKEPTPQCVCCLAELPHAPTRRAMPCGHVYCAPCVTTRCQMAVRDRALAPAHCCKKEFPSDYVRQALSRTEYATYDRFVDERTTAVAPTGELLVSDAEYAAAVAALGARQCPQCGVGVEKISGCDAMRCLRGHWFCFACARAPCGCGRTNLTLYQLR